MDRREFVFRLSASPLILGATRLLGFSEDPAAPGPDPWAEALLRMKRLGQPGLVVSIPPVEADRLALGKLLLGLVEGLPPAPEDRASWEDWQKDQRSIEIRKGLSVAAGCVIVCLGPKEIRQRFDASAPFILMDAEGRKTRVLESLPPDRNTSFSSLSRFAFGAKAEDIEKRIQGWRRDLTPELMQRVEARLEKLTAREVEDEIRYPLAGEGSAALDFLNESIAFEPRYRSWLALSLARLEVTGRRALEVVAAHLISAKDNRPIGSYLPEFYSTGCGHYEEKTEQNPGGTGPTIACGMARVTDTCGRYLRFLENR